MLKSSKDWSGREVNGVILGEPAILDDGTFVWDGGVPDGIIEADGKIKVKDQDNKDVTLPVGTLSEVVVQELADGAVKRKADWEAAKLIQGEEV